MVQPINSRMRVKATGALVEYSSVVSMGGRTDEGPVHTVRDIEIGFAGFAEYHGCLREPGVCLDAHEEGLDACM